jgi:hypothetical protein
MEARCTDSALDPDEWFPVSTGIAMARREAADAIAACAECPVRTECLGLSLRYWQVGQHGVWTALSRPSVPWCVSGSLMRTVRGRARLFCEGNDLKKRVRYGAFVCWRWRAGAGDHIA